MSKAHESVRVTLTALGLWLLPGCGTTETQCDPAASGERTPVEWADLPPEWTYPDAQSLRVLCASRPHKVTDFALDNLRTVLREQAGLDVVAEAAGDPALPEDVVVDADRAVEAGRALIPPGDDPAVVIVVVYDTNAPDAKFGFIQYDRSPRLSAVVVLARDPCLWEAGGGLIPLDVVEATVLTHEVGHWLGVPARAFHTSATNAEHCSNARCVMFKGAQSNACAVLANLTTGMPMRFCPDCAAELAELQRRRMPAGVAP